MRGPTCQPCVDRTLQRDVEEVAARLDHQTEIANGGEAGLERGARVHCTTQRPVGRVVLHTVHRTGQPFRTAGAPDEQVELHVHQTGDQCDIAQIDVFGRIFRQLRRIDRLNPVSVDHDDRGRTHLTGFHVSPACGTQDGQRVRHGTGSDTQSSVVAPESGTFGCFQHSTGNDA